MNGRTGGPPPLSPNGSEWSGYSNYQHSRPPPSPGFPPQNRGNLTTPPVSDASYGAQPRMSNGMNGQYRGLSPPNSVGGRSSYGTQMASADTAQRHNVQMEERLSQHYAIIKRFLASTARDEKGNIRPNRARDKLLRLTPVQFQELSTDVYDELLRRQSAQGQQLNGPGQVPPYLLPRDNFHPKRNQARQKLATLPPPRFRDLATDVLCELERRFPHFTGREGPRLGSPLLGPSSRSGTPNGGRPGGGYGSRNQSISGQSMNGPSGLGGPEDQHGRPTAKQFQSNTIVPNKSTMVEDDDDDGMSDIYGSRRDTTFTSRSGGGSSDKDRKVIADYEAQVQDLNEKIKDLNEDASNKSNELIQVREDHERTAQEHLKYKDLHSELEAKLRSVQLLNDSLQSEIDKLRHDHVSTERDLQAQLSQATNQAANGGEWKGRFETLDRSHQELRAEVARKEELTHSVRQDGADMLNQMRVLSQKTTQSLEREEALHRQVQRLESETQSWKDRYAKVTTQGRNEWLLTSASGIQSTDVSSTAKDLNLLSPEGLINGVDVTHFQIAIDVLLSTARSSEPQLVLTRVKDVVIAVRAISVRASQGTIADGDLTQMREGASTRLNATANNIITASKNFALSHGMSPVSLLDAAASHLSAAVVDLIKIGKIRPSVNGELENGHESEIDESEADYQALAAQRVSMGRDSIYSTSSIPQLKQHTFSGPNQKAYTNGASYGSQPALARPDHGQNDGLIEDLRDFLDSRTNTLLTTLQTLVSSIRTSAPPPNILDTIQSITSTTGQIIHQTNNCVPPDSHPRTIAMKLSELVERLEDKGREGEEITNETVWRQYVQALPPLGFEIAREVKDLGVWVEEEIRGGDFS